MSLWIAQQLLSWKTRLGFLKCFGKHRWWWDKILCSLMDLKGGCYCCDRKARAAYAQSFTLWQQATIEITCHGHSSQTLLLRSIVGITRGYTPRSLYYCLFAPLIYGCFSSRTFHSWWITYSTQCHWRGYNTAYKWSLQEKLIKHLICMSKIIVSWSLSFNN